MQISAQSIPKVAVPALSVDTEVKCTKVQKFFFSSHEKFNKEKLILHIPSTTVFSNTYLVIIFPFVVKEKVKVD